MDTTKRRDYAHQYEASISGSRLCGFSTGVGGSERNHAGQNWNNVISTSSYTAIPPIGEVDVPAVAPSVVANTHSM